VTHYLPEWRFALRRAFVDAMAGDTAAVARIVAEIVAARPASPLRWGVQMDLNRALAAARDGDGDAAIALAIPTVEATPKAQHTQTMRQLVGAVCSAVSDSAHRDAVAYLSGLVASG
jgi:hypothetical protein